MPQHPGAADTSTGPADPADPAGPADSTGLAGSPAGGGRPDPGLRADCENCFGLCCVALGFSVSADFPVDKGAGEPCRNLRTDFRCGVHGTLRQRGFRGCTVYDCFGAGQKISQITFGGQDWRQAPGTADQMFALLPVVRQLQELLRHLTEALTLEPARSLHAELRRALAETERLTLADPVTLLELDVAARRAAVNPLLLRTSELVRARVDQGEGRPKGKHRTKNKNRRGADLFGAGLRGADLRGADLRGAYLIAADLRDADLRLADLIGADLRDADLRGADLTGSIFLVQTQVNAAKGDSRTRLPPGLTRPAHW